MQNALYFKILQRRNKYRNPNNVVGLPLDLIYTEQEYREAKDYLTQLLQLNIQFTYPGHEHYPHLFYKMKEPPLFLEYKGKPYWNQYEMLSVVGAREVLPMTEVWLRNHLSEFLNLSQQKIGIVSGGARGVDQISHLIAIKNLKPTLFILPSGLADMYPQNLNHFYKDFSDKYEVSFLSEFEINQKIHKSNFYFRNRLIAALGKMTLVAQSSLKSGSLLTVHHSLEFGRPILTVPAHPEMSGCAGNIKLLQDGAYLISSFQDLLDFWVAESGCL